MFAINTEDLKNRIFTTPRGTFTLTEHECDTMALLVAYKTNKEIAKYFGNSVHSVRDTVDRLKLKTGCRFKNQLVVESLKLLGLLQKS